MTRLVLALAAAVSFALAATVGPAHLVAAVTVAVAVGWVTHRHDPRYRDEMAAMAHRDRTTTNNRGEH